MTGFKIKRMDKVCIFTLMDRDTKVNGTRINNMEMEKRFGLMEHSLKETIRKVRKMGMERSHGRMDLCIKANSKIMVCTVKDFTDGQMEESTLVIGKRTRCMIPQQLLLGLTEGFTKGALLMTKKKEMEYLLGLMDANMMEDG